jgi:hypothetical protein
MTVEVPFLDFSALLEEDKKSKGGKRRKTRKQRKTKKKRKTKKSY